MPQTDIRGRFLWHDLMTTNPSEAAAFYPKVISWKPQPWQQDASYTMWMAKRGPVGGLTKLPDEDVRTGAPPNWLIYVGSEDVDATIDAARMRGAQLLRDAREIPTVGRIAVLADPQGATFALYSPASPSSNIEGEIRPGDFSWHELATTDHEAALRFYQELFGWEVMTHMDMGPMGFYVIFGWDGVQRGGIYNQPRDRGAPRWLSYAHVESADAAAAAAISAGAKVVSGPMDVPGGSRIAQLIDPHGATFAVHSLARRAQPAAAKAKPKRKAAKPIKAARAVKAAARKKPAARRSVKRKAKRAVKRVTKRKARRGK